MLTHTPASHSEVTADTPCTGHCSTALGDDVCRSCLRTFDEITRWVAMDEAERRAVNLRIALLADRLQHQSILQRRIIIPR